MRSGFSGGEKMRQALDQMVEALGRGNAVRVGFLENSTCGQDNSESAPTVAFYNEYGTQRIPPRPFFRRMITVNSKTWGKLIRASLKIREGNVGQAFAITGLKMAEQLQQSIEEANEWAVPNAPATIKAKGFADPTGPPLQDSKNMKRAVWFEVTDELA